MLDQLINDTGGATVFQTKEALLEYLLPLLDEEPEYDDNLIDYGLTSIDLMKLVTCLRESGLDVSFDELARKLSIDGIWSVIVAAPVKGGDNA